MPETTIRVENLGKSYVLRHQGQRGHKNYTALRDVLTEAALVTSSTPAILVNDTVPGASANE